MIVLGILVALAGCLAATLALYLVLLAVASFRYGQRLEGYTPSWRMLVLVPAHDEVLLVGRTVRSLLAQSYPRELFRICVIADNCTDATEQVARAAGADEVLVRHDPDVRGKGHALRWAMDRVLAAPDAPDAIVSVDADTLTDPDLLRALAQRLEAGAPAVQADYRAIGDDSPSSELRKVGFILMNRTRPAGRNVLGQSACLVGNGWALSAELMRRRPWSAFSSTEDREYTIELDSAGEFIAFAGAAAVHAPTAPSHAAEAIQQERWEGGWASLVRRQIPRLMWSAVTGRGLRLLLVGIDLAVPPLGLLASLALAGMCIELALIIGFGLAPELILPWALAVVAVPLYVLLGLIAADAPAATYRALAHAPLFVLRKPLSLRRTLRSRGDTWIRTERAHGETEGGA
ncbi:MAG TPA: glycosyltransferase family 2 protein [Solirubrobacteraceae bacterium]|jgi:cellulose synthase/poly-beta-1,6-N-acetylglucosamine synthase-like glycosyltransferase|nr:glycosyltransferase family 2 protein [Solirubrobacteraceae bacterium]